MASVLLILALSVLGVHGAVLNTEDTLLKRIARSPGSGHPNPPPPPRPLSLGKGGPPPPLLGNSFSGASASAFGGGRQNGFKSGASASAQASSVAGYNNHGQKDTGFPGKQVQQNGFQGVGGGYKNGQKGIGYSGYQQGRAGQFGGASGSLGGAQGGLPSGKGCSTCEKSNSAISNAMSNSGSATAVAVNG